MKRKTAIKRLMGYGMSRNEANKRLIAAHSLELPNRVAVFFSYLMIQEQIPICQEVCPSPGSSMDLG
jgi:hypothetical protein